MTTNKPIAIRGRNHCGLPSYQPAVRIGDRIIILWGPPLASRATAIKYAALHMGNKH
jgi:hypothetical protein